MRESVYLPVDRTAPPPAGYGLYTVLLTRTADRNTSGVVELFTTTGSAGEAARRENLNLIMIPVKSAGEADALPAARNEPDATAAVMQSLRLRPGGAADGERVPSRPWRRGHEVCGSSPDGPLLVTTQRPLDGVAAPGPRLLIVNLSTTPPEAMREVLAAYRHRSCKRTSRTADLDGWRLGALNYVLDAAQLLPRISKAYTETFSP